MLEFCSMLEFWAPMSALGQKQTYALHQPMSALPPIATTKANFPHKVMSALPPKADSCSAQPHVRFGPEADSCSAAKTGATCDDLFDHIVQPASASARSSASGIAGPSDLTMVRLMMRSNLVGCRDLLRKQRAPEEAAVRRRKGELTCQKPGLQRLEFIERTVCRP